MGGKESNKITQGIHITYYSLMFFIAYTFKGQVHMFAGRVKIVSHSSARTTAILKYFCPLQDLHSFQKRVENLEKRLKLCAQCVY